MKTRSIFRRRRRIHHFDRSRKHAKMPDLHKAFRDFHREELLEGRGRLARFLALAPFGIGGNVTRALFLIVHMLLLIWLLGLGPIELAFATLGLAAVIWSM